ncbi:MULTISPECIES: leucine-rich repeat domain-containing protein [unclassified Sutcliffiella]|uniref:leucine-rich repeat domain-containing protein n=1 Tax=unclassified Sutcliffiella TaxID=2837532 RepID=UPI0030CD73E5
MQKKLMFIILLLLPLLILWGIMFQLAPKGIYFADKKVEEAVREVIQEDGLITQDQLKTIEELAIRDAGIENLEGIHFLTELKTLDLRDNRITDIKPIGGLTKLVDLNLRGNQIADISTLTNFEDLRVLNLRNNLIEDISPLSKTAYLEDVNLRHNRIENIEALQDHEYLTIRLYLEGNPITDYSPIDHYYPSIEDKDF